MPLTNYAIQQVISNLFGGVALPTPGNYYLALSTTTASQVKGSTTPFWGFTEPVIGTGGYARLQIVNNTTNFGAIASEPASGYSIQNNTTFSFAVSTGAWSTGATNLVAGGIFDAATGGNLWAYGTLNPAIPGVNQSGVQPLFNIAQFVATFT